MRYNYEFKKYCVDLYRKGLWAKTPDGVKTKSFHDKIRLWVRMVDEYGLEALEHKNFNKTWTAEKRFELVADVLSGKSISQVALTNGISNGQLCGWIRKYKTLGYNGLVTKKKGRLPKEPQMEKKTTPTPLTESEREELIRLRAEIEYIKAENEVIKKEIALREEKAAQLKAKKQRLSKNSVPKASD